MSKHIQANAETLLKRASDANFWRKQLRGSKLAVCDALIAGLDLSQSQLESATLADWLDENKPVKPSEAKRTPTKPEASTMGGTASAKREEFPNYGDGLYIVTAAQNNTNSQAIFAQLKAYAEKIGAELLVMPIHYNKNAFSAAAEDEKEYFCKDVTPYLLENDVWLGGLGGVRLAVSANVLPTAKQPVNAAQTLNAGEAVTIVASPKQDMQQIAVMQGKQKRQAWTTGCCTVYNYLECRAGAEAEANHKFGGLLIDVANRQVRVENLLQGSDGSFTTWQECADNSQPVDVVLGDSHFERYDERHTQAVKNWLAAQNVDRLALHDILHFETRSHYNRVSGNHLYKMQVLGKTVHQDLQTVIEQTNALAGLVNDVYLVESNHNSAIDNWLDDMKYNPKHDPQNSKLYYLLNFAVCSSLDNLSERNALQVALEDCTELASLPFLAENVRFGAMDVSELWAGVEVSQHGHKGQNGSFGSTALFGRCGDTMITGHTHTPAIRGWCFTVGVTASLEQGYNRGGRSSWEVANAVILPNGAVQLYFPFPTQY